MKNVKIFDKIDRGILFGSKQVIDIAKRTKTPIVISDKDGNIITISAKKAMMNYNKAVTEHRKEMKDI